MPRNAPTYSSGTFPAGGGSQNAIIATMIAQLEAYQSNGEQAWELANEINSDPANYEAVWHSVGDRSLGSGANKGDTDIWVYLHKSAAASYEGRVAQDYSPTSGAWSNAYHAAGSGNFASSISDTVGFDWWCVVNEYEFVFIWLAGGTYNSVAFGQTIRPYSAALNGVARITSQSGTGNGVVIGTDRDISSSIEVNQYVWLVNQTPDGVAIQSVANNLVKVTAKGSSSLTVDGVTNTYAVGSLVGLDPAPTYFLNSILPTTDLYFVSLSNGNWVSAIGNAGGKVNPGASVILESDYDPGPEQMYVGFQPVIYMEASPRGFRGKLQHFRVFTLGTQADQDLMEIDFDSGQTWKCFVAHAMFTSWVTGIGPGAS